MNFFLFVLHTFQKESKVYLWMIIIVSVVLFLLMRFVDMSLTTLDLLHQEPHTFFIK
jgi:hypothetical protein